MTDNLFDNFNLDNGGETKKDAADSASVTEPLKAEPAQSAAEESAPREPEAAPEKQEYTDIFANSADYKNGADKQESAPAHEPEAAPEGDFVVVKKTVLSDAQAEEKKDYDDGFYHQRFSSQTGGANVNYTRPAGSYADAESSAQNAYGAAGNGASQPNRYATRISSDDNRRQEKPRRRKEKSGGMSKGGIALLLVVCLLISGAAGFGGSILANTLNKPQTTDTDSNTMVIHKVDTELQTAGTEALVDKTTSEITNEVADTVVEITTEVMQTNSFYGQYIAEGAGSGVIISSDGYIVTNNHVIEDASSVKVTTRSGESYDATLVGTDPEVDIALLKIDATDLPAAVFGDSDKLTVGSKAVIIGNPLGTLGGSVTEGIISALDRSIVIDGKTMHLMQTDAAINPGNSGGGMFNGQGELSGIVVAKSSSEEIDNIGFVIPINNVLDIIGDLKEYGYVRGRADTGMTFIDLSNQMYAYYYYGNNAAGVYISSVESGSNAAQAGFKQGDRVISVDGKEISSADEITEIISSKSAGDTVTFDLERGGSKGTLELTLEEDIPDSVSTDNNSSDSDSGNAFDNNGGGQTPQQRPNPFGGLFGW
ncbi:MAG: trypsin-like peptidase domain-containing protein [Ruminococcus sp.]|nr:trypsin-like peptidase domain-containing protein [Ruminococcus sp.]